MYKKTSKTKLIKTKYIQPNIEVINFHYTDVVSSSFCSAECPSYACTGADCSAHGGCTVNCLAKTSF